MDDVWTKLESNAYQNRDTYPSRPRKPLLARDATPAQLRAYADQLENYDHMIKEHLNQVASYHARSAVLENQFRDDLESFYHMKGHDKADLLYSKAWHMGHSGGLTEVANYYSDLIELVK